MDTCSETLILAVNFWAQYFKSTLFYYSCPFLGTILHPFDGQWYSWISFLSFFSDFDPESFDLHWFLNDSCILPTSTNYSTINNDTRASGWGDLDFDVDFSSKQSRYKTVHLAVFLGLLLVGILELLFGLSQIIIGFLGCLCGVSKRRGHVV